MDNKSKRVYDRSNKPSNINKKKSSFSLRQPNKAMVIVLATLSCAGVIALTCMLNIALYNNSTNPPIESSSSTRKDPDAQLDINSNAPSKITISDNASDEASTETTSENTSSEAVSSIVSQFESQLASEASSEATSSKNNSSKNTSSKVTSSKTTSSKNESSKVESEDIDDGKEGYLDGSIFIYDKTGLELFYGTDASAEYYAKAISEFKKLVGKKVNVYNLVVPNHTEFGLPKKYSDMSSSQYDNLNTLFSSYTQDVKAVNIYDTLKKHKDEYIYFNTDHHWTALGAYYGYCQFASVAGFSPISLSDTTQGALKGFRGSLINATGGNADLESNLDTLYYYEMPGEQSCQITTEDGDKYDASLLYPFEVLPENSYSIFIWGDNPYMTIKTDVNNGKKIMVVKESYGNAIVPFLAANYEEIYVVDFRYYKNGIATLVKEKGINDVLFLNGIVSANSATQVQKMRSIFY